MNFMYNCSDIAGFGAGLQRALPDHVTVMWVFDSFPGFIVGIGFVGDSSVWSWIQVNFSKVWVPRERQNGRGLWGRPLSSGVQLNVMVQVVYRQNIEEIH